MKLIIQIPCFNEEQTLPLVFKKMPRKIAGIDKIEFQIIDDGSTDNTRKIARSLGIKHILTYKGRNRRWLGRAFKMGVENALLNGADILVNTDGDNQYPSEKIPDLIKPILEGRAEIVIGNRHTDQIVEFSPIKKFLQRTGNVLITKLVGETVYDAVSGFRAYSKEALIKLNIVTNYTYTVDTLMQAVKKGLDIEWINIKVNKKTRESRLIKNLWEKITKSGFTILRVYTLYEPLKTFFWIGGMIAIPGLVLIGRFLYYYLIRSPDAAGHIQSLVIGGVVFSVGFQIITLGLIGDMIRVNRVLTEDIIKLSREGLIRGKRFVAGRKRVSD